MSITHLLFVERTFLQAAANMSIFFKVWILVIVCVLVWLAYKFLKPDKHKSK